MTSPDPDLLDTDLESILSGAFESAGDELLVVNPTPPAVRELVRAMTDREDDVPTVKVIADKRTLKTVMEDFIVASNAADLIDRGVLRIRTTDDPKENSLLVTGESVVALVDAGGSTGGLTTDREEFVDAARSAYGDAFDRAEEYSLRTPPISRVRQTLADEIGPDVERDFTDVLGSLETARGDGEGLDEVTISLLAAAKNETLLYDISRWGEDVGIASKATFSRTKTELEDVGIIETEKVPIDVGRPRLRLKFGDERLKNADSDQIASIANSLLN